MSTPQSNPEINPQPDSTQPVRSANSNTSAQAAPTQAMPQIPTQQFPQTLDAVYQAVKDSLMHSPSFVLGTADDVAKTVTLTSRIDGAPYAVHINAGPQGGAVVQFVPQGHSGANLQMESTIFFGELNRALMMRQMNLSNPQNPDIQQTWAPQSTGSGAPGSSKKASPWVLYISIAALVVSVIALILLIVLTSKTGAWLVWVLGIVSLALSGFSLYAALALDKNVLNRILSGVAVGVSVLAIILGCVNLPKESTAAQVKAPASSASSEPSSSASSNDNSNGAADANQKDEQNNSAEEQNQASVAGGLDEIAAGIEKDMQTSADAILAKKTEAEGKLGDTLDSYKSNESALTDWYAFVASESKTVYGKVTDSSIKYMQTLSQKASADKYLDADALLDDFYKTVYEDAFEGYYDDIYDTAYEDVYDKYYDGVLEDRPENMEYSEWSDLRSAAYKAWSDSKSDFYSEWSDMKSAVYTLYSDVNSDVWNDRYDFAKAIERFQKKTAQFKTAQ